MSGKLVYQPRQLPRSRMRKEHSEHTYEMVGQEVQAQTDAKCFGVWWRYDLSPAKSVEECVYKARRAFFALESIGAFHGR